MIQLFYIFVIIFFCDIFAQEHMTMDQSLQERIDKIRQLKEQFNLDQKNIADYTQPKRTRVTVARVLSGQDERYLTETNVEAIEKAIESILNEYRKKLCK